jgi:hypothetical protein
MLFTVCPCCTLRVASVADTTLQHAVLTLVRLLTITEGSIRVPTVEEVKQYTKYSDAAPRPQMVTSLAFVPGWARPAKFCTITSSSVEGCTRWEARKAPQYNVPCADNTALTETVVLALLALRDTKEGADWNSSNKAVTILNADTGVLPLAQLSVTQGATTNGFRWVPDCEQWDDATQGSTQSTHRAFFPAAQLLATHLRFEQATVTFVPLTDWAAVK